MSDSIIFASNKKNMQDNFRHKGLRKKLIEEIASKKICSQKVLDAMGNVPRHLFMESSFINFSYKDNAFPIGAGQTISQPSTVAFQTELLKVEKGHKVLEVGTGSGYQTAILMELGAKVYTIERQRALYVKTSTLLPQIGYKPHFFFGDGYDGKPSYGPYDGILVTAGASEIPEKLKSQLKIGGRMVIPVGGAEFQKMLLIKRIHEDEYEITEHGDFAFVPLLKGTQQSGSPDEK